MSFSFHSYFGFHSLLFLARIVCTLSLHFPLKILLLFFWIFLIINFFKRTKRQSVSVNPDYHAASQMSMVPLVFRNWWDDFERPVSRLLDQHFGTGLNRAELISNLSDLGIDRPTLRPIFGNRYYRPWGNVMRQNSSGTSTIQLENDNFQVGIYKSIFFLHNTELQRNGTLRDAIRSKVNLRIFFLPFTDLYDYELALNGSLQIG